MKIIVIPIIQAGLKQDTVTFKFSCRNEPNLELAYKHFTQDETTAFHYVWNQYHLVPPNNTPVAPIYKSVIYPKMLEADEIIIVCAKSDSSDTIVEYCKYDYAEYKNAKFFVCDEDGLREYE